MPNRETGIPANSEYELCATVSQPPPPIGQRAALVAFVGEVCGDREREEREHDLDAARAHVAAVTFATAFAISE